MSPIRIVPTSYPPSIRYLQHADKKNVAVQSARFFSFTQIQTGDVTMSYKYVWVAVLKYLEMITF